MITNKQIKELVTWNRKAKARKEDGVFLAEGTKMFLEAQVERIRKIVVSESFFEIEASKTGKNENNSHKAGDLLEKLNAIGYETVPEDTFKKISDTMTPQGILCVMDRMEYTMDDLLKKENPTLMVLEDLQDPGNLGTIMRTGEGAGIDGIIMSRGCVDIYNPKTIRSTMGSLYRVPFIYTEDLRETVLGLKEKGISFYAAHLKGTKFYDEVDYTAEGGIGFLIGNEGNGLTDETAGLADTYIKIPMEGRVESLNAAIAASVLMYEAYRQKRKK